MLFISRKVLDLSIETGILEPDLPAPTSVMLISFRRCFACFALVKK